MRRASAAARHLVWTAAFCALLLLPALSLLVLYLQKHRPLSHAITAPLSRAGINWPMPV